MKKLHVLFSIIFFALIALLIPVSVTYKIVTASNVESSEESGILSLGEFVTMDGAKTPCFAFTGYTAKTGVTPYKINKIIVGNVYASVTSSTSIEAFVDPYYDDNDCGWNDYVGQLDHNEPSESFEIYVDHQIAMDSATDASGYFKFTLDVTEYPGEYPSGPPSNHWVVSDRVMITPNGTTTNKEGSPHSSVSPNGSLWDYELALLRLEVPSPATSGFRCYYYFLEAYSCTSTSCTSYALDKHWGEFKIYWTY